MKSKILTAVLLIITVVSLTSCFTSRSKYGCPGNPTYSSKFRG